MRDALGDVQSVLVLGGRSDIALGDRAAPRRAARPHRRARRPPPRRARGRAPRRCARPGATTVEVGARSTPTTTDTHAAFVDDLFDRFGDFDVVLVAFGVLGDQAEAEHDAAAALDIARVNYLGAVSVAVPVAHRLRAQGHGTHRGAVVGRRRAGPALELRLRLVEGRDRRASSRASATASSAPACTCMVVRPGFVHTKMTEGLERGAAVDDAPTRSPTRSSPASRAGARPSGCPARCAT